MPGAVADRQRVVAADDSRLMRRMLADALGRQGLDVVATAGDGDEALAAGPLRIREAAGGKAPDPAVALPAPAIAREAT